MYHKCRVSRLQYTGSVWTTLLLCTLFLASQYPPYILCVCVWEGGRWICLFVTNVQRIGTWTERLLKETQWRIQDFPGEGGGATPKVGVLTYYFAHFLLKTAWKWKNLDPGGGGGCPWSRPLDPSMKSIIVVYRMEFDQIRWSSKSCNRPVVKKLAASLF